MNDWGQISLAEIATTGLFASDEALRDDEFLAGLADAAWYDTLSPEEKAAEDARNAWADFAARDADSYATACMTMRFGGAIRLMGRMTNDWCAGKLTTSQIDWLRRLNMGLDKQRAGYRKERATTLEAARQLRLEE